MKIHDVRQHYLYPILQRVFLPQIHHLIFLLPSGPYPLASSLRIFSPLPRPPRLLPVMARWSIEAPGKAVETSCGCQGVVPTTDDATVIGSPVLVVVVGIADGTIHGSFGDSYEMVF